MEKLTTFMLPPRKGETNVTVPTLGELQRANVDYRLSDFAMFSGAIPQPTISLHRQDPVPFGMVWTSSLFDHHEVYAMTVDNVFSYLPVRRSMFTHAKNVAVAPRFVNPEKHNLGTYYHLGSEYLTLNGEMVYHAQSMVTPSMAQKLTKALIGKSLPTINNLPYHEYAADHLGINDYPVTNPYTAYGNFYRYAKHNYALYSYPNPTTGQIQYYWFNCEPIKVERDKIDNSLQCLTPLFAASYETVINQTSLLPYLIPKDRERLLDNFNHGEIPSCRFYRIDPNYTPLGQYLNGAFMNQLAMSTNFNKIDQLLSQQSTPAVEDSGFEM